MKENSVLIRSKRTDPVNKASYGTTCQALKPMLDETSGSGAGMQI